MGRTKFTILPKVLEPRAQAKEFLYENDELYLRDSENVKSVLIETSDISDHISNTDNPHKVDIKQLNLDNVIDIKQATYIDFINHETNYNNPHKVNKTHIGLDSVLNIEHATKEDLDKIINEVKKTMAGLNEYFLSVVDKLHLVKHELIINTIPEDVTVKLFYDKEWNMGKEHDLYVGYYNYEISKEGFETKTGTVKMENGNTTVSLNIYDSLLTFNVTPLDAEVKVYYNNQWNVGNFHEIPPGSYQWEVFKEEYINRYGEVSIVNGITTIDINLEQILYNLEIIPDPLDAKVEVYYDNQWNEGSVHLLPKGVYQYKITKLHYESLEESISIFDDLSINPVLSKTPYKLNIVTNPIGIVEVYYNNRWNIGDYHELPIGIYTIQVSKDGYKTQVISVDIFEDTTKEINLLDEYYSLIFRSDPELAKIEVEYDGIWNEGKSHLLKKGIYNYKISYAGMESKIESIDLFENTSLEVSLDFSKFNVNINTIPIDALIEVEYDGKWNAGASHSIIPGSYNYRISKEHYNTIENSLQVIDKDVILNETLTKTLYKLQFNVNPINAVVSIKINNEWFNGTYFELEYGEYEYIISQDGYESINDILLLTGDSVITKSLTSVKVEVTISTDPTDATVEVEYPDGTWVLNNIHMLSYGVYNIRIVKDGYNAINQQITVDFNNRVFNFNMSEVSYIVNINVIPDYATVKVYYDNKWTMGNTHKLPPGTYDYEIYDSANNYISKTDTFEIIDMDKVLNVELEAKLFNLVIDTEPVDALVKVYYNNQWNEGSSHLVPFGTYQYEVSKE